MKEQILKTKDGKEGMIGMPEDLNELIIVLGSKKLFKVGLAAYRTKCLRQIRRGSKPKDKVVKFKMSQLSPAQKAALSHAGLLQEDEG